MISINNIKKLREKTKAGVMDCRKALEQAKGDMARAQELINKWGIIKSAKKEGRDTKSGLVHSYIHGDGKVGVLMELLCETDFVARTGDFQKLAHELCLQVASMDPQDTKELLNQDYIRNPKIKIIDLVKQEIGKLGENMIVSRFTRYQLGQVKSSK